MISKHMGENIIIYILDETKIYKWDKLEMKIKKNGYMTIGMLQGLRALAALPENPGSILTIHMGAHNCL